MYTTPADVHETSGSEPCALAGVVYSRGPGAGGASAGSAGSGSGSGSGSEQRKALTHFWRVRAFKTVAGG